VTEFIIKSDTIEAADVIALLDLHLAEAYQDACSAAFGREALSAPNVTFFTARDKSQNLAGFAALKIWNTDLGEIKSVRTHSDFLRRGVSTALMKHLTTFARSNGLRQLSLETHPTPAYAAARALYERLDFNYCDAFGDYENSPKSVFMTKTL